MTSRDVTFREIPTDPYLVWRETHGALVPLEKLERRRDSRWKLFPPDTVRVRQGRPTLYFGGLKQQNLQKR